MTDVLILHATLPGEIAAGAAAALLAQLPYGRRLELERRDAAACLASLAGIALVLAGAGRLRGRPVDVAQLRFPQGGKPSLAGGPSFSVSHSGRRVAVALCADAEVGLDFEEVPAGNDAGGPAARALGQWTATEAALKSVGAGLRAAREVRLSEDGSLAMLAGAVIHLRPVELAEGCVACLATPVVVAQVTLEEVTVRWPPPVPRAAG